MELKDYTTEELRAEIKRRDDLAKDSRYKENLEVKDEEYQRPKHSYHETIYHCGTEPTWKVGDVLAEYEFYTDREGEYVYGKVIDIRMNEDETDWVYTFEDGSMENECTLIHEQAYKKPIWRKN